MRILLAISCMCLILSCTKESTSTLSPHEVYANYNSLQKNGITFEEMTSYYTSKAKQRMDAYISENMIQWNKTREEVIEIQLSFTQSLSKCKEITLLDEKINGEIASLTYAQTDICGNDSGRDERQKIELIYKNGWKIERINFDF